MRWPKNTRPFNNQIYCHLLIIITGKICSWIIDQILKLRWDVARHRFNVWILTRSEGDIFLELHIWIWDRCKSKVTVSECERLNVKRDGLKRAWNGSSVNTFSKPTWLPSLKRKQAKYLKAELRCRVYIFCVALWEGVCSYLTTMV